MIKNTISIALLSLTFGAQSAHSQELANTLLDTFQSKCETLMADPDTLAMSGGIMTPDKSIYAYTEPLGAPFSGVLNITGTRANGGAVSNCFVSIFQFDAENFESLDALVEAKIPTLLGPDTQKIGGTAIVRGNPETFITWVNPGYPLASSISLVHSDLYIQISHATAAQGEDK